MMKDYSSKNIIKLIENIFPDYGTELKNWKTDFQFLICILLSAQTTDVQVNKVTGILFCKYPDIKSFANASVFDIQLLIKSINFYKTKSRHIVSLSKMLLSDFNSNIPSHVNDLIKLPGVGKKTANVFLNELFKSNQGIAVDTHVARVSQRLGLTNEKFSGKIAFDLERFFEKEDWYKVNSLLVLFGRYNCVAKKPLCSNCIFRKNCKFFNN